VVKIPRWSFLPFFKKTQLEVTIGIPEPEDFKKEVDKNSILYEEIERLKRTLKEVMEAVRLEDVEGVKKEPEFSEDVSNRVMEVYRRLTYRGVRKEIAKKFVEDACGYDMELRKLDFKEGVFESLKESIEKNIRIEEDILTTLPKVIALVGPTGVSKTTTIAKLAYLFKRKSKSIGVITLDSYRVGAVEQLRSFVKVLELPLRIAESPTEFGEALREMSSRDIILVDTAGRSQHDKLRLNELKLFFDRLDASIYLTLSTNLSELVMYETILQYGVLPIRGLIFSKLDETSYPGSFLNVAYRTQMPILCFTTGQTVPDDIVIANYEFITKLLLEERHEFRPAGGSA
jgi:flagellar biosynthesis protein FlhF